MQSSIHSSTCPCCTPSPVGPANRRQFMRNMAVGAAALGGSLSAFAASGKYDFMLLSCIDPRFQEPVRLHAHNGGPTGKYSSFVVAGGAIGVVAPAFKEWHRTFWENLGASVQLHAIQKVVVINHRDCGAAKIAYGAEKVATPEIETQTHRMALQQFRDQLRERHPKLGVETGLMALDGKLERFS